MRGNAGNSTKGEIDKERARARESVCEREGKRERASVSERARERTGEREGEEGRK